MTASRLDDASAAAPGATLPVPRARRTDMSTRLFYGFGSVAFGVKDNGFSYMLLFFYGQVVGLSPALVGLALFIALLFDACIDPLIGQVSDNLRTPLGRRHPFMYAAAAPFALCYLALWNPPHWGQQALFVYLVVLTVVIRTVSSFFEVPNSALAAEFSGGYEERSVLLSYRYFFGWVGGLTVNYLAYRVLLTPDRTHAVGQLNPIGYSRYGLVAAVIIFCAILISSAGTHRHIPTLMPPPPRRKLTLRQTLAEMGATLNNRSFIFLLISGIASAMAAGLGPALNSYFNTYFWEFSARQISYLTAGVFLSAFMALGSVPYLSRRFGKRMVTRTMMVLSVGVGITPLILRLAGLFPANHSPYLLPTIFCTSVIGVAFGIVSATMGSSMIADVVEEAELKTGRRSEGLFFAASAFIGKAVSGFGILAAAAIIQVIHLQPGANPAAVPPAVPRQLAEIYCPVLIALYAGAFVLLGGYRITRASHAETLQQLTAEAEEAIHPAAAAE
ncbi:MAG TPA: MFS transporter [Caulobacteraceae bacterium]|nr:MFS transporter [Caulobacteraceae bacterium]